MISWDQSLCVPQVMEMPRRSWQVLESCGVAASSELFIPGGWTCRCGGMAGPHRRLNVLECIHSSGVDFH